MYVLDTDVLSLVGRRHPQICQRIEATFPDLLFTTIATVEEALRGCLADIHASARNTGRLIVACERLREMQSFLAAWQALPFDHAAARQYNELLKRKVRVHTNDLRIAAIALSRGFILVVLQGIPWLRRVA